MIFFGSVLSVAIMAAVITMAVKKDSELNVRVASIIAVGLMVFTLIICFVVVFTDNRVPVDESVLIVGVVQETSQEVNPAKMAVLALLIIFFLALFFVVTIFSIREHRKLLTKTKK